MAMALQLACLLCALPSQLVCAQAGQHGNAASLAIASGGSPERQPPVQRGARPCHAVRTLQTRQRRAVASPSRRPASFLRLSSPKGRSAGGARPRGRAVRRPRGCTSGRADAGAQPRRPHGAQGLRTALCWSTAWAPAGRAATLQARPLTVCVRRWSSCRRCSRPTGLPSQAKRRSSWSGSWPHPHQPPPTCWTPRHHQRRHQRAGRAGGKPAPPRSQARRLPALPRHPLPTAPGQPPRPAHGGVQPRAPQLTPQRRRPARSRRPSRQAASRAGAPLPQSSQRAAGRCPASPSCRPCGGAAAGPCRTALTCPATR